MMVGRELMCYELRRVSPSTNAMSWCEHGRRRGACSCTRARCKSRKCCADAGTGILCNVDTWKLFVCVAVDRHTVYAAVPGHRAEKPTINVDWIDIYSLQKSIHQNNETTPCIELSFIHSLHIRAPPCQLQLQNHRQKLHLQHVHA